MSNATEWKTILDASTSNDLRAVEDFVKTHDLDLTIKNAVGQTAAHIAAKNGNFKIFKYLLEKQPSLIDIKDAWGQTVFHMAVQSGALDIVKHLGDKVDLFESNLFFPGSSSIHIAAAVGKLNIFKYFIEEKKIDADLKNESGQPSAFSAAARNHLCIVKYLAEETNANLTTLDDNGDNILYMSARTGDLTIPKYLLNERNITFDINWRNFMGETLVNRASAFNNYYFVRYIVDEKNADVNIADNEGSTPLHEAADVGTVVLVKYLVEKGANPDTKNNVGKTPKEVTTDQKVLDYLRKLTPKRRRRRNTDPKPPEWEDIFDAAEHNDEKAVKYFIEKEGTPLNDANLLGETVVHIAAQHANFAILDYMLNRAPYLVAAKDMQTNTPLHAATKKGHLDVIKYLIEKRNATLLQSNFIHLGNTIAHMAAEIGNTMILKYLIEEKRVDVDIRNDLGQSPLFSAASYNRLNVVKYLVEEKKANITMTDVNDDNILYVTARTGDLNLPKYLLDEKKVEFDINRKDKFGETLVKRAARFGRLSFIKYLVDEKRADINLCDKNSRTPLHEAACMGHTDLVKYLIERGADPEFKDKWGRTHTQDNTYQELINEWRKVSSGKRERRNVAPATWVPSRKWIQRIITNDRFLSVRRLDGNDALNSKNMDSFLIFADVCVRYIQGSPYRRAKSFLEEARVDPFVIDAIYATQFDLDQ